ncbi:MAG: pyrophosphatase [Anaerolineaceae bacterium]|nr:pyrophosphatase [Anaerolineaceae bacterium]
MEINVLIEQLETISLKYAHEFGIERTPDWFLLKLTEELGELMQSYLKFVGQARAHDRGSMALRRNLEDELADVIGMALLIAKNQNIDIEKAIARKWLQYLPGEKK